MDRWNTTFKKPVGTQPDRLASPPRAHVEPLSPPRPRPVEPHFNYPATRNLNNRNYSPRPDQSYTATATPRPRTQSLQQKSTHKRTPSTIDTLAEAALAVSPSFHLHSRSSSATGRHSGYNSRYQYASAYGASEPPHKRARSELLPSPALAGYVSRPATSYEHGQGFPPHGGRPAPHTYESRVEDAALLLNFRTGGWPSSNAMSPPARPVQPSVQRPHANSFPRDVYNSRAADPNASSHGPLLPPFSPHQAQPSRPTTASQCNHNGTGHRDATIGGSTMASSRQTPKQTNERRPGESELLSHTPRDESESHTESVDVAMSEVSETTRSRRGVGKGKGRAAGSRKGVVEKAASKRASVRKKVPFAKSKKGASKTASAEPDVSEATRRRKSMSDVVLAPKKEPITFSIARRGDSVPLDNHMLIREASPSKTARRQAKVAPETICAACSTSRERTTTSDEMDEWISCNGCKEWFHIDCAGFKKAHEVRDVDKYFCKSCEPKHGQTTYVRKSARAHASVDYAELQRGVLKTSEESQEHHYIQPIKDGSLFAWDPESFPRMRPEMVTRDFFEKSGTFVEPICIPAEWNSRPWDERAGKPSDFDKVAAEGKPTEQAMSDMMPKDFEYDPVEDVGQDKLDMVMPEGLTVRQVCDLVGPDYPLDVIDVKTQNSGAKMNLAKWADYYEEDDEDKQIRNVISLEVSQSKLARLLRRPKVVRDIDLQDEVWPQEEKDKGKWPKVQYYCLMSIADSYTDFHIDFGGSSVYYHILKGKKTFFFIPPKPKHLKAYEEWNESPQQNYTFLGNITKECYRVDLKEGDTMLIPSGWIHAVWTPETSLVIGGNFLTRMSFKNQFRVVEIEKANKTPMKFRYPFFQKISKSSYFGSKSCICSHDG